MPNDPLCTCTEDGCWCESSSTKLSDDAIDTIRGGIRERLELTRAKLADVRRQRRELLGLKEMTREQAAELIRIREGKAPNYQRLAPIAEKHDDLIKTDPLGRKIAALSEKLALSDEPDEVGEVPEAEAPKKRGKFIEIWR
jgi:hypothetical protein